MAQTAERPPSAKGGPGNTSSYCGDDTPENSHQSSEKQRKSRPAAISPVDRAKLELLRDLFHESLGFAILYAEVGQTFAEVGDDPGALHAANNFRLAANSVCAAARDIRAIRQGGAP